MGLTQLLEKIVKNCKERVPAFFYLEKKALIMNGERELHNLESAKTGRAEEGL